MESDDLEDAVVATLQVRPGVRVVTWDVVRSAGQADVDYLKLVSALTGVEGVHAAQGSADSGSGSRALEG